MDDMVGHLCSISEKRFIISFAPYTPFYAALKMLGSLAPGPSKVTPARGGEERAGGREGG